MTNTTNNEDAATKRLANAWILLNEDEPKGTVYPDPTSCYQTLIKDGVYQATDILYLCFAEAVPTSATTVPVGNGSSYTLQMGKSKHADGLTNQDYMDFIIRDSRKSNPKIKIAMTLLWGNPDEISNIFSNNNYTPQQNADNFAANLMDYLKFYDLDGFDIDWESPLCDNTTDEQFKLLVSAIGKQFSSQIGRHYYLTISPAEVNTSDTPCMDANTINMNVDFLNLQLYFSRSIPNELTAAGVNPQLYAYGAKWEANFLVTDPNAPGDQTAQEAYADNEKNFHFKNFTGWRLNSQNYLFEQKQQLEIYALLNPVVQSK